MGAAPGANHPKSESEPPGIFWVCTLVVSPKGTPPNPLKLRVFIYKWGHPNFLTGYRGTEEHYMYGKVLW